MRWSQGHAAMAGICVAALGLLELLAEVTMAPPSRIRACPLL